MRKVRKLRHWKQRFDKNARFIWRRAVTWQGKKVKLGEPIPVSLDENKTKLRRFWEAGVIELAQFEEPDVLTGQRPEPVSAGAVEPVQDGRGPADLVTKEADRKWHVEGLEEVFRSKTLAVAAASELLAKSKVAEGAEEADADETEQSEDDAWLDGGNEVKGD